MWPNSQFLVQDIIGDTAMKNSTLLTVNTCVTISVIIKDRNSEVFVPQ